MKFLTQTLATAALLATGVVALRDGIIISETYGGPHGDAYSDMDKANPGQKVNSITIRTGERVNGVGINFVGPDGTPYDLYHGGGGGDGNTLTLGEGEYVTGIEAHWGEYHSHTRVRFIQFTTNKNHSISGGTRATKIGADHAEPGYQLGGFFGTDGVELDSVGAIWTRISTTPETTAPVTEPPTSSSGSEVSAI
ncbi:uncharacterized protein IUM83_12526 [Phytophthora cinnamomi]|uniref:uncharacterized protein n=1 Tax=Phytophthora cinnamomi TaxID=4785 RepID=UPI00355A90EB|nr:hypothetical protein IUM83_12526 [Phytophthora cinnamomi]